MPRKSKAKIAEEETMTKPSRKVSPSEKTSIHNDNDDANNVQEVWDFVRTLSKESKRICCTDGCEEEAVAIWASNLDHQGEWSCCEVCQENDFGGWPEAANPTEEDQAPPASTSNRILDETLGSNSANQDQAEVWDLKKILAFEDINKEATIKCSSEECLLPACCIWVSNLTPNAKWYSCLDCQERDFGGWPSIDELPLDFMEPKHLHLLSTKCSSQKSPALPKFPSLQNASPSSTSPNHSNFVTPPPNSLVSKATQQANGKENTKNEISEITPATDAGKKSCKPSSAALAIHKKWQDAAEAMGGKDTRIVVKKPAAKKLVFDLLFDAFRPMNITEIYKALKATVPSPVLNACLNEMALDSNDDKNPFVDSDKDEDSTEKPSSHEPYEASLTFKPGKKQSTNLYYVDHTKLKGLDHHERDALFQDCATATAEKDALQQRLKLLTDKGNKLLSEPTNEEIEELLETEGKVVSALQGQVEEAKKLQINQKHKEKTKRNIQKMAAQWRKRKRMCMDFLINMEEITDGSVRATKCFSGDGQMALDSDDAVAKAAIEFEKKKRSRGNSGSINKPRKVLKSRISQNASSNASLADESFVAVNLDSQHNVIRVYVDERKTADSLELREV